MPLENPVEVIEIPNSPEESERELPKPGSKVIVTKLSMEGDQASRFAVGESKEGMLIEEVAVGKRVLYGMGNTSPVKSFHVEGDKLIVETQTSTYQIEY